MVVFECHADLVFNEGGQTWVVEKRRTVERGGGGDGEGERDNHWTHPTRVWEDPVSHREVLMSFGPLHLLYFFVKSFCISHHEGLARILHYLHKSRPKVVLREFDSTSGQIKSASASNIYTARTDFHADTASHSMLLSAT